MGARLYDEMAGRGGAAAGIEPATIEQLTETKARQEEAHPGQVEPQVGHAEGVTSDSPCTTRTLRGQERVHPGQFRNTTYTQLSPLPDELHTVIDAWSRLPEPVREGIVAMVKALDR